MVDQQLISYIRQQINAGYNLQTIKLYLINYGYNANDIDEAIAVISSGSKINADQQLVQYIQQQVKNGYDINAVRQYLISSGYPQQQVDAAISAEQKPEPAKHLSSVMLYIAASIIVVALLAGMSFFLFAEQHAPELLDLNIDIITASLDPGDDLKFNLELESEGAKKRFDVKFEHVIYNSMGEKITSDKQTIAIETSMSKQVRMKLPEDAEPGKYFLESTATYNDQEAFASVEFAVKGEVEKAIEDEEEPIVQQPKIIEDLEDEEKPIGQKPEVIGGIDYVDEEEEEEEEASFSQIEEQIKALSADPDRLTQAGKLCSGLALEIDKDTCYFTIVDVSKDKEYCDNIISNYRRDTCYVSFVIGGDSTVCSSIIDPGLRSACEQLSKTPETPEPGEEIPEDTQKEESKENTKIGEIAESAQSDPDNAKAGCESLGTQTDKDTCFSEVSAEIASSNFCSYIIDSDMKDECYLNYAIENEDYTVCGLIVSQDFKGECEFAQG